MSEAWKAWEGQVVDGKFPLRKYIAGGEDSAVFLTAYGEGGLQKAAIKLVRSDRGDGELRRARWERAAKLSHPHLVRLFEAGAWRFNDLPLAYVVMEYADEVLSGVLPYRPLTPEEGLQMLEPAIGALTYLHGQGLAHGHLKPSNIMAVDDQLKIASDGVRRLGEAAGPGAASVYDPPEITESGYSPAGDVWSLGVTLVEALTQRPPVGEPGEVEESLAPETVPEPFREIARHCLRRDPQRRWTVADIAGHLRGETPAPPRQAPAAPKPVALQAKIAKQRYILPAALALAFALAAMLAGPRLLHRQPETHQGSSRYEQPLAQPVPRQAAAIAELEQTGPEQLAAVQEEPQPPAIPETRLPARKASAENETTASSVPSSPAVPPETEAKPPGNDLVPAGIVRRVVPDVPANARDTIQGKVRVIVRVEVDESGRVANATLESPGPSKYFADLALGAARGWQFQPAKIDARSAPSEWRLRFEFGQSATDVFPLPASTVAEP